jgi:hypothetical protein
MSPVLGPRRFRVVTAAAVSMLTAVVVSTLVTSSVGTAAGRVGDARHSTVPVETPPAETVKVSSSPFVNGPGAVTLAGTGSTGFGGDGGLATSAELAAPGGIAEDSRGDLFITDSGNCRVREVPVADGTNYSVRMRAGHIYTIAGGPCDDTGRSVPPAEPYLGFATSLAVDSAGDVFVAGGTGNEIFELPTSDGAHLGVDMRAGRLSVVAGDGSAGNAGNGELASAAQLNDPQGVAVDPEGDLFIADTESCEILEVASRSGMQWGIPMVIGHLYTVAGTGTCGETGDGGSTDRAELWDPVDVVVGPRGDLLVSDGGGEEILDLPSESGTYYGTHISADHLATVAGIAMYGPYLVDGLPATGQTAELNSPAEIALDGAGDLFIANPYSSCIREVPAHDVSMRGKALTAGAMYTVAGALEADLGDSTTWTGPETLYPSGVAVTPDGAVVYSDAGANVVRELSS